MFIDYFITEPSNVAKQPSDVGHFVGCCLLQVGRVSLVTMVRRESLVTQDHRG